MFRKFLAAALLVLLPSVALAGPFYEITTDSTKATLKVSGFIKVAPDKNDPNSTKILLDGENGNIEVGSMTVTGLFSAGSISVSTITMAGPLTVSTITARAPDGVLIEENTGTDLVRFDSTGLALYKQQMQIDNSATAGVATRLNVIPAITVSIISLSVRPSTIS